MDGFEIPESYGAHLLDRGGRDENVHGDSQMVRDGEVRAGEIIDGDARGADQVQCMTFLMGGKIDMLGDIEKM